MAALGRYTWMAQLILHGLILSLAISILGVSAHLLQTHNSHAETNPWYLPLWPQHFDMRGVKATVGSTTVMTFFGLIVLVMAFLPRFSSNNSSMPSLLIFATTLPSAVLTLATLILTAALNHNEPVTDTIQTWTCRWSDYAKSHGGLGSSQNDVPKNFGSMCTASRFTYYGLVPIFILQVFLLLTSAVGVVVMLCSSKKNKSEGGLTPIKEHSEVMAGMPAYEMDYRGGKNGTVVNSYGMA